MAKACLLYAKVNVLSLNSLKNRSKKLYFDSNSLVNNHINTSLIFAVFAIESTIVCKYVKE